MRDLSEYEDAFGEKFVQALRALDSRAGWIDWGAGAGQALVEFSRELRFDLAGRPKLLAVAHTRPQKETDTTDPKNKEFNQRIEALDTAVADGRVDYQELDANYPYSSPARAAVGTDYFGLISYATDLSQALQNEIDSLKLGGELFIRFGRSATSIYVNGVPHNIPSFLGKVEGLKVELIGYDYNTCVVTKMNEIIQVPKLTPAPPYTGTSEKPPIRYFELR